MVLKVKKRRKTPLYELPSFLCVPLMSEAILSREFCPLVRPPKANWSWVRSQRKNDLGDPQGRTLAHWAQPSTARIGHMKAHHLQGALQGLGKM